MALSIQAVTKNEDFRLASEISHRVLGCPSSVMSSIISLSIGLLRIRGTADGPLRASGSEQAVVGIWQKTVEIMELHCAINFELNRMQGYVKKGISVTSSLCRHGNRL